MSVLTVTEVAKNLGCSRTSVFRHITDKSLPATKRMGVWVIKSEDLGRFLATQDHNPRLLGVTEIAGRLGVNKQRAWVLLASGAIPSVQVGCRRRATPEDVDRYSASIVKADTTLMSIPEAAALLGKNRATVWARIKYGGLPATIVDYRWWVRREDVLSWKPRKTGPKVKVGLQ